MRCAPATLLPADFDLPGDALDPAHVLATRQHTRDVLEELSRLPARQRDALIGHAVQGRSVRQMATVLGTSEKAVKALTHRGRAAVQQRTAVSV
jgi:DNA-directed RNA polymerase specialized sigma24 family protein